MAVKLFVEYKIHRLIIIAGPTIRNGSTHWKCRCVCGNTRVVRADHLNNSLSINDSNTKSCGCLGKDKAKQLAKKLRFLKGKYSGILKIGSVEYASELSTWRHMHDRCYNTELHTYKYYGGRGIKVCKRWKDNFINFYNDMGKKPAKHSIDRINNDGNYTPKNCKWSTRKEQDKNRSKNYRRKI